MKSAYMQIRKYCGCRELWASTVGGCSSCSIGAVSRAACNGLAEAVGCGVGPLQHGVQRCGARCR